MQPIKKLDLGTLDSLAEGHLDKVALASQVGAYLASNSEIKDRAVVENLARVLSDDVSQLVRQTLAMEIRSCSFLPDDVAERIALDVQEVAVPFLEATQAFAAERLARLVPELKEFGCVAVARRDHVPAEVSRAVVQFGGERAVATLMDNVGAEVPEDVYLTVIDRFSDEEPIMESLAGRPDLPMLIVESVIAHVSDAVRNELVVDYGVSTELAHMLSEEARVASLSKVLGSATIEQVSSHVRDLANRNELTAPVVLSLVEKGNRRFFEVAMAELVGIPLTNVRALMRSGGDMGIDRLLSCAGIGDMYVPLFEAALANIEPRRR